MGEETAEDGGLNVTISPEEGMGKLVKGKEIFLIALFMS